MFSLFNTQPCKFQACRAGLLLKGLQILGKRADQNFWPFLEKKADQNFGSFLPPGLRLWNLINIFSLFNTQPNRPRASPASFKYVGQAPLLKGLQILGKRSDQNFGPFLPPGPWWWNLIKIFILFNTQNIKPRDSPASFKPVGQALFSRVFKFGENVTITIEDLKFKTRHLHLT